MDPETAERLAALGYLGGGRRRPRRAPTGRDPKDGIGLVTRLGRNGMSVARTDPQKAIRELTALLAEDPGMLVALRTRAVAYAAAGAIRGRGRATCARSRSKGALSAEDASCSATTCASRAGRGEATAVLEETARENPRFAQPWLSLAEVHVAEQAARDAAARLRTRARARRPTTSRPCAASATSR